MHKLLALLTLAPSAALAREWPDANPGRPSFSTNATSTARGALELETGAGVDADAVAILSQLKYGITDRFDLRLSHVERVGPDVALSLLGLQAKWCIRPDGDDTPGFGVSPFWLAPVDDADTHVFGGIAIVTWPVGPLSIDANVSLIAAVPGMGDTAWESDPVATVSFPIYGDVGGYLESYALVPLGQDANDTDVAAATGVGWAVKPWFVLDASVDVRLAGDDLPDWFAQLGLTISTYVR
jgi:hypothetical protein